MIEFQLTVYMCSHCTRVHNAAQECLRHELNEHVHAQSTPPTANRTEITEKMTARDQSTSSDPPMIQQPPTTSNNADNELQYTTIADSSDMKTETTVHQEDSDFGRQNENNNSVEKSTTNGNHEDYISGILPSFFAIGVDEPEDTVANGTIDNYEHVHMQPSSSSITPTSPPSKKVRKSRQSENPLGKPKSSTSATKYRTHDSANLRKPCPYCGKLVYEVNKHIRSHTGERPFKCRVCDMRFNQTSAQYRHERVVHKFSLQIPVQAPTY